MQGANDIKQASCLNHSRENDREKKGSFSLFWLPSKCTAANRLLCRAETEHSGLSDSVIRAELGIYKWLYCFIEDSGKLYSTGGAGIGQCSEDGIPCGREISVLCDIDVIACVAITLPPSFLIVLYS